MEQRELAPTVTLEFDGRVWYWKGPAPHYFVTVPAEKCQDLKAISKVVTYGWGMIPVRVQIGETEWKTSLFPKDGQYIVPLRMSSRKKEGIDEGDEVAVRIYI